jgi:SAM-dependent methyltransferase
MERIWPARRTGAGVRGPGEPLSLSCAGGSDDGPLVEPVTDRSEARRMWEERYGANDYLYGIEPNAFLLAHESTLPMGEVLCLADGEGRNSVYLAGTGRTVSAVDLTDAGVAKTLRLAAVCSVSVHAETADLADYDLGDERWEGIFAHLPSAVRVDLHRRVVRALRPGGILLLEAYTPDQIGRGTGGPPSPDLTMTAKGLRGELQPLDFLHLAEVDREIVEGVGHTGPGSVVQVIARKAR